jgi:hypothetical protein
VSPAVERGKFFHYFDPIRTLPASGRDAWASQGRDAILTRLAAQRQTADLVVNGRVISLPDRRGGGLAPRTIAGRPPAPIEESSAALQITDDSAGG